MLIEQITGQDYRDVIRERIMTPLGIADEVFVGVPEDQDGRCVTIGSDGEPRDNRREMRAAGMPSGDWPRASISIGRAGVGMPPF